MVELYFLLYRIPRMMTRIAREKNRSALGWSLIAVGAWLGTETAVLVLFTLVYGFFAIMLDMPLTIPVWFRFITYLVSLFAALVSVFLVKWHLQRTPQHQFGP